MRWLVLLGCVAAGCSSSGGSDGGLSDAGNDAGPPPVTDGGALGSACLDLDQCGGNPLCGIGQSCALAVLCGDKLCASAGGTPSAEAVSAAFTTTRLPDYVQVSLLAPQLVGSATMLDCPTLLQGLDAGTLDPGDSTEVNPLFVSYQQAVHIQSENDVQKFELNDCAAGPGRVLLLQAYLNTAASDGGAEYLGQGCATFDNSADAGEVGITITGS